MTRTRSGFGCALIVPYVCLLRAWTSDRQECKADIASQLSHGTVQS